MAAVAWRSRSGRRRAQSALASRLVRGTAIGRRFRGEGNCSSNSRSRGTDASTGDGRSGGSGRRPEAKSWPARSGRRYDRDPIGRQPIIVQGAQRDITPPRWVSRARLRPCRAAPSPSHSWNGHFRVRGRGRGLLRGVGLVLASAPRTPHAVGCRDPLDQSEVECDLLPRRGHDRPPEGGAHEPPARGTGATASPARPGREPRIAPSSRAIS